MRMLMTWVLMWAWVHSGSAWAVIMRDDVPASAYAVDDADYPALVDLFEPGDCVGTLITPEFLLTVAHCAVDMSTDQVLEVGGQTVGVSAITPHPDYRNFKHDIALVQLAQAVDWVTPHGLYTAEQEVGLQIEIVGRGLHGTGVQGEPGASQDTQLRRATNIVTKATEQWLEVHFEAPGEAGITDLEGVGASGDSGGPAFIDLDGEQVIVGLNSWGEGPGAIRVGQYGAQDYSTRVSQFIPWIEEVTGVAMGDSGGEDTGDAVTDVHTPGQAGSDKGCGCASATFRPVAVWWAVGVALAWRRRR